MSRSLDDLDAAFHLKLSELMRNCQIRGYDLVPYVTLRTPHEQAELWRQSRTASQIVQAVAQLRGDGALWLADVLEDSSPVTGREVTKALPGAGWHSYGLACDFYWEVNGAANWDGEEGLGYIALATEAKKLGLTSGRAWAKPDYDHIQLPSEGSPLDLYPWPEIDAMMRERFGGK